MEIKQKTISKLLDVWRERREAAIRGKLGGFSLYQTNTGRNIVTTKLLNGQGWYALVCFYDSPEPVVDVYDRHVFDRYKERRKEDGDKEDVIKEFILRGNATGTIILKDNDRFEKRIKDGATLGTFKNGIIYHKTYITDKMIRENKMDYLFELE